MNQLGLFAKFWQPGAVKTRLGVKIGNAAACRLYRCFLFHLLEQLANCGHERDVVFSPRCRESDFQNSVSAAWGFCPQTDGDLGDRMGNYFRIRFKGSSSEKYGQLKKATKVVVIGADCPLLSSKVIDQAINMLDQVPVVLGPSQDGGYFLIGMRERCYDVFQGVHWSSPSVLDQTIERLTHAKTAFGLLDKMNDIDELDDLRLLSAQLQQPIGFKNKYQHLREEVELALAQAHLDQESEL
ncbi:MAG: TIGR04282 family arsenosugar biosynthesis glycosyltransferase [Mariniblastus sp.]|nr:TIGR04282 family arsenosugar biosynthesis glycosyltransferase [Mariniblastus sp.]